MGHFNLSHPVYCIRTCWDQEMIPYRSACSSCWGDSEHMLQLVVSFSFQGPLVKRLENGYGNCSVNYLISLCSHIVKSWRGPTHWWSYGSKRWGGPVPSSPRGCCAYDRGSSCDSKRYTIPVSNSECECSDRNGAKCISRCSIGDMNFTIAKSSRFHGIANVSCPSAYKDRKLCHHHHEVKCCSPHQLYLLRDCSMQHCENNSKCNILGYGLQYHKR